jgi:hypothetical protein
MRWCAVDAATDDVLWHLGYAVPGDTYENYIVVRKKCFEGD